MKMSKSNHSIMIPRQELEELEKKAELLDKLILGVKTTPGVTNFGRDVEIEHVVTIDKEVLQNIVYAEFGTRIHDEIERGIINSSYAARSFDTAAHSFKNAGATFIVKVKTEGDAGVIPNGTN
jgi:hypothetical protein